MLMTITHRCQLQSGFSLLDRVLGENLLLPAPDRETIAALDLDARPFVRPSGISPCRRRLLVACHVQSMGFREACWRLE